jgi:hypothetical protein
MACVVDVQAWGLLEQPVLVVRPVDASGRAIVEDATGKPVGFAHRHTGRPWWLRWLGVPLAVHEVEEEPVVFRARRLWTMLPRWRVQDAENETVGTVAGTWLLDKWDRPILRRRPTGASGTVETTDGRLAAEWAPVSDGTRVVFHPAVQNEPFVKMLLLAAVLVAPR